MSAFNIGQQVAVTLADDEQAIGTITGMNKGWYTVTVDGTELKRRALDLDADIEGLDEEADPETLAEEADPELTNSDEGDDEELTEGRSMAEQLRQARQRYVKGKKGNRSTADSNDRLAIILRPLDCLQVAAIADAVMGLPYGTHAERYASLNQGQIRMNSGNRIRGALKRMADDADLTASTWALIEGSVAATARPAPADDMQPQLLTA